MPHVLMIDSTLAANWRLRPGSDPAEVQEAIRDAMRSGDVIDVPVQTADDPPKEVMLTVNGGTVTTVTIVEVPL